MARIENVPWGTPAWMDSKSGKRGTLAGSWVGIGPQEHTHWTRTEDRTISFLREFRLVRIVLLAKFLDEYERRGFWTEIMKGKRDWWGENVSNIWGKRKSCWERNSVQLGHFAGNPGWSSQITVAIRVDPLQFLARFTRGIGWTIMECSYWMGLAYEKVKERLDGGTSYVFFTSVLWVHTRLGIFTAWIETYRIDKGRKTCAIASIVEACEHHYFLSSVGTQG